MMFCDARFKVVLNWSNNMKNNAFLAMLLAAALQASSAYASVIVHLDETFESGASFSGNLTFDDTSTNLLAVNGVLSGGSYGTDNINWVYNHGLSANPESGIYVDFLMDGSDPNYSHHIGISWASPVLGQLTLINSADQNYWNQIDYIDKMVSYTVTNAVPVPAAAWLLGSGLLGLMAVVRLKAA